jgi:hypothetical protein
MTKKKTPVRDQLRALCDSDVPFGAILIAEDADGLLDITAMATKGAAPKIRAALKLIIEAIDAAGEDDA